MYMAECWLKLFYFCSRQITATVSFSEFSNWIIVVDNSCLMLFCMTHKKSGCDEYIVLCIVIVLFLLLLLLVSGKGKLA